jgi:hypothetical protein
VLFALLYLRFKGGCGYFVLFKHLLCTCNKGKSGVALGGRLFLRQQKPATPLQKPIMRFSKLPTTLKPILWLSLFAPRIKDLLTIKGSL